MKELVRNSRTKIALRLARTCRESGVFVGHGRATIYFTNALYTSWPVVVTYGRVGARIRLRPCHQIACSPQLCVPFDSEVIALYTIEEDFCAYPFANKSPILKSTAAAGGQRNDAYVFIDVFSEYVTLNLCLVSSITYPFIRIPIRFRNRLRSRVGTAVP